MLRDDHNEPGDAVPGVVGRAPRIGQVTMAAEQPWDTLG